jgi:peptidoglycan/LPS O-acetylase OafA/YrhL
MSYLTLDKPYISSIVTPLFCSHQLHNGQLRFEFSSFLFTFAGGGALGFAAGFSIKRIIKIALVVLGAFVLVVCSIIILDTSDSASAAQQIMA